MMDSFYASGKSSASMSNDCYPVHSTVVVYGSERITKLKEKIDRMQTTAENERASQLDRVNSHFQALEDRLKSTMDARNSAIAALDADVRFRLPFWVGTKTRATSC